MVRNLHGAHYTRIIFKLQASQRLTGEQYTDKMPDVSASEAQVEGTIMHDGRGRSMDSWQAVAAFWVVVLTLCLAVGAGSFFAGRALLGPRLEEQASPVASPWSTEPDGWFEGSMNPLPQKDTKPAKPADTSDIVVKVEPLDVQKPDASENTTPEVASEPPSQTVASGSVADEAAPTGESSSSEQPEAEEGTGQFEVRVGTFAEEKNSRRIVAELTAEGYNPYVTKFDKDGITLYRVSAGRFQSRDRARQVQERLVQAGHPAYISSQ